MYNIKEKVDRINWLDSLKPGDKVAVSKRLDLGSGGVENYDLYTIQHITPKRTRFDTLQVGRDYAQVFDRDGEVRIGGSYGRTLQLVPVTQQVLDANERFDLVRKVWDSFKTHQQVCEFSTENLRRIHNIILEQKASSSQEKP